MHKRSGLFVVMDKTVAIITGYDLSNNSIYHRKNSFEELQGIQLLENIMLYSFLLENIMRYVIENVKY